MGQKHGNSQRPQPWPFAGLISTAHSTEKLATYKSVHGNQIKKPMARLRPGHTFWDQKAKNRNASHFCKLGMLISWAETRSDCQVRTRRQHQCTWDWPAHDLALPALWSRRSRPTPRPQAGHVAMGTRPRSRCGLGSMARRAGHGAAVASASLWGATALGQPRRGRGRPRSCPLPGIDGLANARPSPGHGGIASGFNQVRTQNTPPPASQTSRTQNGAPSRNAKTLFYRQQ